MTFSTFQERLFADESTSSPEDSPVSHSQQPESERAEPMNDISFRKCFELFQRSDRVGSSLKTFAACLVSNLDRYSPKLSHHWKAKATRSSRFVFLLQPSKPRTGEIGSGLLLTPSVEDQIQMLPTPNTKDGTIGSDLKPDETVTETGGLPRRGVTEDSDGYALTLGRMVQMLPTPTTNYVSGGANRVKIENGQFKRDAGTVDHSANLQSVVAMLPTLTNVGRERSGNQRSRRSGSADDALSMLPTPATRDYKGANSPEHLAKERGHHDQLPNAIAMLRTPAANEPGVKAGRLRTKDGEPAKIGERAYDAETGRNAQVGLSQQIAMDGTNPGLRLQPAFVEWMQSFPLNWTSLEQETTE